MPITPQEAEQARVKSIDQEMYRLICLNIDRYLSAERKPEYWCDVSGLDQLVVDMLIVDYRAAGWVVSTGSDRDGYSLILRAK